MIEFVKAFKTEDGKTHTTIEDAQRHELSEMIKKTPDEVNSPQSMAAWMLDNASRIVDILTTKKTSKPRARSINGGRKVRTVKPTATPEAA